MPVEIFDDLQAEQDALDSVLATLSEEAWAALSAATGWSNADVVLHLAQTEEAVVRTAGEGGGGPGEWRRFGGNVEYAMDQWVRSERAPGPAVLDRWRKAREMALEALRAADPARPLAWVAAPLKPRTLATTRLAEHWAHALDITGPLGIPYPDTDRLRHIAWLGHSTLPYAFALAGEERRDVYCELTAPGGEVWRFGSPLVDSSISGPAGAFCRVGARRLTPEASGLVTRGSHGTTALRLLRNFAG